MADFNPINSEEELLAVIAARGLVDPTELNGKITGLESQLQTITGERDAHAATISGLQAKVHGFELDNLRHKVAREKGLPFDLAGRISGDTEEAMMADAENLLGAVRAVRGPAPLFDPTPTAANSDQQLDAALAKMLAAMRG